jgi:hypothetical protein
MMSRRTVLGIVLFGLMFSSFAGAQKWQVHATPQQAAELNRLVADASEAVNQISDWDIQQGDLMDLVSLYSALGEQAHAHAIVQVIWKKYAALSEANASGQNPPPGMQPGMSPATELSTVASELAQFGDPADALDIVKRIGSEDPTADALQMIAIKQAQEGDAQEAMRTAASIPTAGWRDNTLGEIVYADLHNHDTSDALVAASHIPASPETVHQLIRIAYAQLIADEHEAAAQTVSRAERIAVHLPEHTPPGPQNFSVSYVCSPGPNRSPRDQALQYVAQGQWELGDRPAAMATRGEIQSSSLREQALYDFVKVDAGANRFSDATQLVGKLPPGSCSNYAKGVIASAEVAAGDVKEAIALASEMQPASSMTWIDLALKAKDTSTARALFSLARAAASKAPTELGRAESLYGLAAFESLKPGFSHAYCADSEEAIRLAREAHANGEHPPPDLGGSMSNNGVYEAVMSSANCGKLAQARALVLTQEGLQREDEIGGIAAIEVKNGDPEDAERWAQTLTSPSDRASALIGIATAILPRSRP